jgi:hypothetical protein
MLKRLTRKLVTLSVLCAALAAVSSAALSTNSRAYCYEVPLCAYDCCSGYYCCDRWGNCYCG